MRVTINYLFNISAAFLFLVACSDDCEVPQRCELKPDPGPCEAAIPRYYFDTEDCDCKEFLWGGCDGVVPFETMEGCQSHCLGINGTTNLSGTEIVFGHFFGECFGEECVEIYRLTADSLFEDTNDNYPSSLDFYSGNWIPLDNPIFESVKDLLNNVPDSLISDATKVFGQPDAGDWGGYYFEYKDSTFHNYWLIDNNENNLSEQYLIDFKNELNRTITTINN